MSIRYKFVSSKSNTPSKDCTSDHNNQRGNNKESIEDPRSLEPNTKPNKNTPENPLQTNNSSCSEIFTEQTQTFNRQRQQKLAEVFSLQQTRA